MPSFPETTAVTESPVTEEVVVTDGAPDNSTEGAGNGQATFEVSALLALGASLLFNF